MTAVVRFSPQGAAACGAFLVRVRRLDDNALLRVRPAADLVELCCRLPVGVLAVLSVPAELDTTTGDEPVVAADVLLRALAADQAEVSLSPRRDAEWVGGLPSGGFERLDAVPAEVVSRLASAGARTFRQAAAGRSAKAASTLTNAVLDHVALTVSGPAGRPTVEVTQRLIQGLAATGLVGESAPDSVVQVEVREPWLRLRSAAGAVYLRRGGGLNLLV
ncbi:hypothetical protein GCM10009765_57450 [Fodinicola feengrottensis]|uniref:Uncharacterized protein n=1 Tax=Fodinicola feengrottensis TaxID=435914 RepID=A0ABP4U7T1_9ACTN